MNLKYIEITSIVLLNWISIALAQEYVCDSTQWIQHGRKCYFISNNDSSWYKAKDYCYQRNATLTSILNNDEQTFLHENTGNHAVYWIGLRDINISYWRRNWKWLDGTTLNFSKLIDDIGYSWLNCVGLVGLSGEWKILPCTAWRYNPDEDESHLIRNMPMGFICKKGAFMRWTPSMYPTEATSQTTVAILTPSTSQAWGSTLAATHHSTAVLAVSVSTGVFMVVTIVIIIAITVVCVKRRKQVTQSSATQPPRAVENDYSGAISRPPTIRELPSAPPLDDVEMTPHEPPPAYSSIHRTPNGDSEDLRIQDNPTYSTGNYVADAGNNDTNASHLDNPLYMSHSGITSVGTHTELQLTDRDDDVELRDNPRYLGYN